MSIVLPFALVGGPFTRSTQIYVDLKDGVAAVWPYFLSLSPCVAHFNINGRGIQFG